MAGRSIVALLLVIPLVSGCVGPQGSGRPLADDGTSARGEEAFKVQRLEWQGHIVHGALDPLAHMRDPETALFPIHKTGFLVAIDEVPRAIEVTVSWDTPGASFVLHPHYKASDDPGPGGETVYYGYLSERFTQSPGCIRVPAQDMDAGVWPMMVRPDRDAMDVDFVVTVAIQGAQGRLLDDMHGHRSDGPTPVLDHGVEECVLSEA